MKNFLEIIAEEDSATSDECRWKVLQCFEAFKNASSKAELDERLGEATCETLKAITKCGTELPAYCSIEIKEFSGFQDGLKENCKSSTHSAGTIGTKLNINLTGFVCIILCSVRFMKRFSQ